VTVRDLITETFQDLTVLAASESMDAGMAANGLSKLLRVLDDLNAERAGVYANRFQTYTLTPALQPHTIGVTGNSPTWTVTTARPVSIDGANLVLTDVTPNVYRPLNLRSAEWWRGLPIPTLSTSIPTDLYYNPEWPNGQLYFWPVPDTAWGMQLWMRIVLADVGLDDTFTMPQGYRSAITLTLGEYLAPTYPSAIPQAEAAAKARARIFANNDETPALTTQDSGMPRQSTKNRTTFNYRTGMWN